MYKRKYIYKQKFNTKHHAERHIIQTVSYQRRTYISLLQLLKWYNYLCLPIKITKKNFLTFLYTKKKKRKVKLKFYCHDSSPHNIKNSGAIFCPIWEELLLYLMSLLTKRYSLKLNISLGLFTWSCQYFCLFFLPFFWLNTACLKKTFKKRFTLLCSYLW